MSDKLVSDINWKVEVQRIYAMVDGNIIGSIIRPNEKRNYFAVSQLHSLKVREKFLIHSNIDGAKKAIEAVYLGVEEKPDDVLVTGQAKAWNGKDWLLSNDEYREIKVGFIQSGNCDCRVGAVISHGADIAGRTEAALYLTSALMTSGGYVMRFGFLDDSITKVAIDDAPVDLHISRDEISSKSEFK